MDVKEYLAGFYKTTKNPSIEAMQYFMKELGYPDKELKIIHVAGTNGKGSVTEMMTNILVKAGYKIGKFISPHLINFNERISVNHKEITDTELESYIIRLEPYIEKYDRQTGKKVTLFELITTIALLYFKEESCDFVVLETGLGGLYDSTNVVDSLISVITSIGRDHIEILGKTIEEIAVQKAGIIKENADTVFPKQEESVTKIIEDTCKAKNTRLHFVELEEIQNWQVDKEYQSFDYKERKDIKVNLKGEKQIVNSCICLECVDILKKKGFTIAEEAVREGLKTVVHRARFETLSVEPIVIFDGAHNEPAMRNFVETVGLYAGKLKRTYIVSILKRKDYKKMLEILMQDKEAEYIFTSGDNSERFVEKEELEKIARQILPSAKIDIAELTTAMAEVKERKGKEVIFFVGSLYTYEMVSKAF